MTDALRDALEPFAKLAEFVSDDHRDSRPIMHGLSIVLAERLTIGHLRAAKAALATAPQALAATPEKSRIERAKAIREEQQCSLQEAVRLERAEFLTAEIQSAATIEDLKQILLSIVNYRHSA